MSVGALVIAVLLLAANGYFVAVEFALVGARRSKLQALADQGNRRATHALDAVGDLTFHLAGAQLGITMASLALGYVAEPALVAALQSLLGPIALPAGLEQSIAFIVGLGIVVFLHLVVGEMVPKGIALADPERTMLALVAIDRAYLKVFGPLVRLLNVSAALVTTRVFRVEPRDELAEARTAEEFAVMLAESHEEGVIADFAHDLLTGVLDFGGLNAGSVMVPRASVAWVPSSTSAAEIERLVVDTGHSRVLITDGGALDNVRGFVHNKDLLTVPDDARADRLPPRLVRRLLRVGTDWSLEDVLLRMRQARVHLAVVLDDGGSVAGILTLEDLLEELVGDILDETDPGDAPGG